MPTYEHNQVFINSIILLVLSTLLSFLSAYFWFVKTQTAKDRDKALAAHDKSVADIFALQKEIDILQHSIQPISGAFQAMLIEKLTHEHEIESDALLVKIGPPNVLTPTETLRLGVLLDIRIADQTGRISDNEKDAATILPVVMRMAELERKTLIEAGKIPINAVVSPVQKKKDEESRT